MHELPRDGSSPFILQYCNSHSKFYTHGKELEIRLTHSDILEYTLYNITNLCSIDKTPAVLRHVSFFFSFLFLSSDFCDQPNVAEFNDTPMTEYCDSALNMKRLLKDINGYRVQRRLWLWRETTAARALPPGAPHAGLGTTPDVAVSTGEPRARAPPSDCARQRELRRWFCPRRQRRAFLGFKSSRINSFSLKQPINSASSATEKWRVRLKTSG